MLAEYDGDNMSAVYSLDGGPDCRRGKSRAFIWALVPQCKEDVDAWWFPALSAALGGPWSGLGRMRLATNARGVISLDGGPGNGTGGSN